MRAKVLLKMRLVKKSSYNSHEMLKTFSTPLCALCPLCPLCPVSPSVPCLLVSLVSRLPFCPLCPLVSHLSPVSPCVPCGPLCSLYPLCPLFSFKNMKYSAAFPLLLVLRENFDGFHCFHMTTCEFFFSHAQEVKV